MCVEKRNPTAAEYFTYFNWCVYIIPEWLLRTHKLELATNKIHACAIVFKKLVSSITIQHNSAFIQTLKSPAHA
jgi:hypothetical protein